MTTFYKLSSVTIITIYIILLVIVYDIRTNYIEDRNATIITNNNQSH